MCKWKISKNVLLYNWKLHNLIPCTSMEMYMWYYIIPNIHHIAIKVAFKRNLQGPKATWLHKQCLYVEDLTEWVSSTISVNKRALTCSKPINLIRGQVCQLAMSRENQSLSASSWCSKHIHPSKSIVACELLPGGYCNMVSINTLKCPSTKNWTLTAQSVLCWWSWPLKEYDLCLTAVCIFITEG